MADRRNKFQKVAIRQAIGELQHRSRTLVVAPCGTGKTRIGYKVATEFLNRRGLVMAPTIDLVWQNMQAWQTAFPDARSLVVCSGKNAVDEAERIFHVPNPTTDTDVISEFLRKRSPGLIFSTYASAEKISDAMGQFSGSFDIAVFDEAHHLAGSGGKSVHVLDDEFIPVKKRLFLTATPRVLRSNKRDVETFCMNDPELFGNRSFELPFSEAIEQELLTDYRVVVIACRDPELSESILADPQDDDAKEENEAKLRKCKEVALCRAIRQFDLTRVFPFFRTVRNVHAFCESFPKTAKGLLPECHVDSITADVPIDERKDRLKAFAEYSGTSVMASCRCLAEGVDCPAVDCVAFMDSKQSIEQIVQNVGRALRLQSGKALSYIFVPVFQHENGEPDKQNAQWDTLISVLNALRNQDERLESWIRNGGSSGGNRSDINDLVQFVDLSVREVNAIQVRTMELCQWEPESLRELADACRADGVVPKAKDTTVWRGRTQAAWYQLIRNRFNCSMADFKSMVTGEEPPWEPASLEELADACRADGVVPKAKDTTVWRGRRLHTWCSYMRNRFNCSLVDFKSMVTREEPPWEPASLEELADACRADGVMLKHGDRTVWRGRRLHTWCSYMRNRFNCSLVDFKSMVTGEEPPWEPASLEELADACRADGVMLKHGDRTVWRGRTMVAWRQLITKRFNCSMFEFRDVVNQSKPVKRKK